MALFQSNIFQNNVFQVGAAATTTFFGLIPDNFNILDSNDDYTVNSSTIRGWDYIGLNGSGQVVSAAATAPDGTLTGQKIVEDTGNSTHLVIQNYNRAQTAFAITYRVAVFAKQATRTRITVRVETDGSNGCQATYDLAGGTIAAGPTANGTFSAGAGSIASAANGWYLCKMDFTTGTSAAVNTIFFIDNGSGSAAASTSYIGDGSSGIYLWRSSLLPSAAWDINARVFFEDFDSSSTIDLTDSRNPGFTWYTHNAWPEAVSSVAGVWHTAPATPSAAISVSGSVLTLAYDSSGFGEGLNTVAYYPNRPGYVGTNIFKPPFLFEARIKYDPTLALGSGNPATAPVFWANPIEFYTSTTDLQFVELDVQEAAASGAGTSTETTSLHNWPTNNLSSSRTDEGRTGPNAIDYSQHHRYGALWLTQAANGGTCGYVMTFFDGVATTDVAYSATTGSSPAALNGNTAGIFTAGESQHYSLILGAGGSSSYHWPLSVDYVRVYQQQGVLTVTDTGTYSTHPINCIMVQDSVGIRRGMSFFEGPPPGARPPKGKPRFFRGG